MERGKSLVHNVVLYHGKAVKPFSIIVLTSTLTRPQALGLLTEMENRGVAPDIVSYNTALDALAKCGEYEKVIQFFQEIENKGI